MRVGQNRPKEDGLGGALTKAILEPVFNLGNYTWVEQQNAPVGQFDQRQSLWRDLHELATEWDAGIREFNNRAAT